MERRHFGLDKCRTDLDSLSNGYIQTEAIYAKATPLKKVDESTLVRRINESEKDRRGGRWCRCEAIAENTLIAQCTSRGKMNRKTKQSTAIIEELSRESIAEC
ncbi:hypothetical protein F511_45122 [Dorcoceras hygrometricum]|uniref:Uncharacterized protein n=1 Tax=Dorcoceras hygrometricum TaxID=472368 RepID=A0A2Z6ZWP7_9LAMI|nr:hypothetical protein F511_45122 [Dorcoceras hygrometricum]